MAWSLVAHAGSTGASSPVTTAGVNTSGADLLVVVAFQYNGSTAATVTDNKSNSWSALTAQSGGAEAYARIWYVQNPTVGSGHTITVDNGTTFFGGGILQAWSGSKLSGVFDQQNGANATSGANINTGSITPSENDCLVIAGVCTSFGSSGTTTIDGGFSVNAEQFPYDPGIAEGGALAYLVQTTAAAANPLWAVGSGDSVSGLAAVIASFKPATGGGGSTFPLPIMYIQNP